MRIVNHDADTRYILIFKLGVSMFDPTREYNMNPTWVFVG